ncbi:acyltransferase [Kozakia baliensis]|uniref:Uncharacterized protein n=1 Tax=Kozakia baliensis TaxID=153496 RepID=A0A1D8UT17_9PROT|nr:acyltransferase [Kozakia baliensis]AOX16804.1 hypothetical protein A0U89_06305 [Kozakia baliensis]GBR23948.1 putative acetyltransferase [Kozakia baliensis NRIC 0488]GEL65177.1 hypothetical protein KBA01_24630 [Kozakia baliensis]
MIPKLFRFAYYFSRHDNCPWEFNKNASNFRKTFQKKYQNLLRGIEGIKIAQGGYIAFGSKLYPGDIDIGEANNVSSGAILRGKVHTGANVRFGVNCHIAGPVTVGSDTMIGNSVSVFGFNHGTDTGSNMSEQPLVSKGIHIGDDCWIGANATILDGVVIGDHSIVAAGAVVTKSIPPWSIVGGVPARVLRDRRFANNLELLSA